MAFATAVLHCLVPAALAGSPTVSVSGGPDLAAIDSGSVVTVSFTARNPATEARTALWALTVPDGWRTRDSVHGIVRLEPRGEEALSFELSVPADASSGRGGVTLTLRRLGSDDTWARATKSYFVRGTDRERHARGATAAAATAGDAPAVAPIGGAEPLLVRPQSVVTVSFVARNPTSAPRSAHWSLSRPREWRAHGADSGIVHIAADGAVELSFEFSVPADAAHGPGELTLVLRRPRSRVDWSRASKPYAVRAASGSGDDMIARAPADRRPAATAAAVTRTAVPTVSVAGGPDPTAVSPRSGASVSFVARNPAAASRMVHWQLSVPERWSTRDSVSGIVRLAPNSEVELPFDLTVPADADPGPGRLALVLRRPVSGEEWSRAVWLYDVAADVAADTQAATNGTPIRVSSTPQLPHPAVVSRPRPGGRSGESSTASGGALTIAPGGGPAPLTIAPRSVVSASFALTNSGQAALPVSWELGYPARWNAIGPVSGRLELPARGEQRISVLLSVPADAVPGSGLLTLAVHDPSTREWLLATKPYEVAVTGRLVFRPDEDNRVALGGVPYRVRRWLVNTGNVTARVELDARSSSGWEVELTPGEVDLLPGMGQWVDALVKPPPVWEAEVPHSLTVFAQTDDLPDAMGQAVLGVTTRVLSGEGGRVLGLRGTLELEGILPVDRSGGAGLNLRLAGDIGPHQHLRLQLGDLLSIGKESGLRRRGTFVDLTDERWGGLLIGSTGRAFTPLTAPAQRATWGEIRLRSRFGTWSVFSSLAAPDSLIGRMAGLSLESEVGRSNTVGLIAFQGEHAPNSPQQRYSMATVWASGRRAGVRWQGEVAAARLHGSDSVEPAWRFAANGSGERWSWGAESQRAAAAFPGTIWNYNQLWGRVGYRLHPSLRLWVGGQRLRSPDLAGDGAFDSLTGRAGVTWSGLPHGSVSLSHARTSFRATAEEPVPAVEHTWNLALQQDLPGSFTAASTVQLRERREDGRHESGVRASYELRHRPDQNWLLQARFEPAPTGERPFDYEQRWSFLSRWQPTERTWFEMEGEALRCGQLAGTRCRQEPSLRLSLGRNLHGPLAGWRLTGYAQRRGTRRDLTAGVTLARDVAIRSPFGRRGARIEGELRRPDGRPGPAGVRLRLGERTVVTDARGEFRFSSVPMGDYLLDVEELGLSLMVDRPLPIPVTIAATGEVPIKLQLVEPGRVAGVVWIERGPNPQSVGPDAKQDHDGSLGTARDPCGSLAADAASVGTVVAGPCWAPLEGITIHLQHTEWSHVHEVAESDGNGRYRTAGLLPGRWRVWVASADVPMDRESSWPERGRQVDVRPDETVVLDELLIRWHRRPEEMLERPALVIALQD